MKIIERIKTKPGYKIIASLVAVTSLLMTYNHYNKVYINNIKNDSSIDVICNIKNEGWISIDKDKIVNIYDNGYIQFTNGGASNCKIKKNYK